VLLRTLEYWSSQSVSLVVIHNTENPLNVERFSNQLTYKLDRGSYGERCAILPELIETKYSILSADDELYTPSGLSAMRSFLEENESFSSVGGRTLAIGLYGKQITGTNAYSNMNNYMNSSNSSLDRICNHYNTEFGNRIGGIYRLMRTENFKRIMHAFGKLSKVKTPYIFEVTGEVLINSMGNCVYLPQIYWIRNWINEPVQHGNWDRKLQFTHWLVGIEYADEVSAWKNTVAKEIGLTPQEIELVMQRILEVRSLAERNLPLRKSKIQLWVPVSVKAKLRSLFLPSTMPANFESVLETMRLNGARFDLNEIKEIVKVIS
jgi:glycosyltransferase domain-containing protein